MANKHKHADMIIAKANNMDLVVFSKCKCIDSEVWTESDIESLTLHPSTEHFVCLPQHKEACLHWLNGGSVHVMDSNWINIFPLKAYPWEEDHDFMLDDAKIRIAPKKEKRWVATFPWAGNAFYVTPESFASEELLNEYVDFNYGKRGLMLIHEIEVEV